MEGRNPTPINLHQCVNKCADKRPCSGKNDNVYMVTDGYNIPCFCDGYCKRSSSNDAYCQDIDFGVTSKAVCGSDDLCKRLCDAEPGCYGGYAGLLPAVLLGLAGTVQSEDMKL